MGMLTYQFYSTVLQNLTLPFIECLFIQAINKKKISYSQIKKTFEKTGFGISFNFNRGCYTVDYTWFSIVDVGIREFFKQFQKFIKSKQPDWRFTIDFLAPKFEAIFREIVKNAGGEITRVKDSGDSELKTLEELFSSSAIKEIFNEDDMLLFRYTFTKVGLNIRNDVAHGIYLPCEYTTKKAILVFFCILRLNKVSIYIGKCENKS